MNFLVMAQHHGAFITLESIPKDSNVVVFVPQSQIDKYSGFPEPVFKNYFANLKKYCDKKGYELYIVEHSRDNMFTFCSESLFQIGKKGVWAVLPAGAIYQSTPNMAGKRAAFVRGRVFDKDRRLAMYSMIGLPENDPYINNAAFFLNLDEIPVGSFKDSLMLSGGDVVELGSMGIGRPDPLVGKALSALECLRMRTKSIKSHVLYYWMQVIARKHAEQEFLAYPFEQYAVYAKKVKKQLPESTYEVIVQNSEQSAFYKELAQLDL